MTGEFTTETACQMRVCLRFSMVRCVFHTETFLRAVSGSAHDALRCGCCNGAESHAMGHSSLELLDALTPAMRSPLERQSDSVGHGPGFVARNNFVLGLCSPIPPQ
jgi:hypothetical protein